MLVFGYYSKYMNHEVYIRNPSNPVGYYDKYMTHATRLSVKNRSDSSGELSLQLSFQQKDLNLT